jgi:DNA primase
MWLERKYISLLSARLQQFKTRNHGFNFRCPFCGDSQSSKYKARGWIYEKKGDYKYHCFNCSISKSFPYFLKDLDQQLYNEYRMECIAETKTPEQQEREDFIKKMEKPKFMSSGPLKGLKKVSQLKPDHKAHRFVTSRRLPTPSHIRLFYCPNFKHYVNGLLPGKFDASSLERDEGRLLIPFFDANKNVHALQGRALGDSKVKYITIILDESVPKVYGLDTANFDRTIYVFEGPLDSLFIPNSIATAGGDLVSAIGSLPKNNLVIVYDNEPRSRETIKKIDKAILQGYSVCIWPDNLDAKDVNDMVLSGLSADFIKHIIDTHTYRDLAAKLALSKWSKA